MDYYNVLMVPTDASQEDIKKAYQQLILIHHPDKSAERNQEMFLKIDEGKDLKIIILVHQHFNNAFIELLF